MNPSSAVKNINTPAEATANGNPNPEWLTVAEACAYARISKGLLYNLLNRQLIRSVSLRQLGQSKGKRIVGADSLRNFLNSRATGGEG